MGLSTLTVNVGKGGLGRRPLNEDKISGLLFFNDTLPSGFGAGNNRVKKVYSLEDAELLGIAEGSVNHDVAWYHISEYFRGNPEGELWIGYFAVPGGAYDFTEIVTMVNLANGEIRQLGIYADDNTFAGADVTLIQGQITICDAAGKPLSVIYAPNFAAIAAVTGWTAIADLRALDARKVSVIIGEDGGAAGAALAASKAYSITALGACLGLVSRSFVQESVGNPARFNASNGTELEVPAMANGDLVSALSDTTLGALVDKGYTILRKYVPKISGTYFERMPTATPSTDDFAFFEYNRVVDKAIRGVQAAMVPQLNGVLATKADGSLRDDTVTFYQDLAQAPLDLMAASGEISAAVATIDPSQDVLGTSQLIIAISIVPLGIANEIIINIGLTTSL